MYQDACNTIQKLIDENEKIHFIAFTKGGDLMLSVADILTPLTFKTIIELLEYVEKM